MAVESSVDLSRVRRAVAHRALQLGFGTLDQTRLVTAASELARNMLSYAGGGRVEMSAVRQGSREGLRIAFTDTGPGIADVEGALADGFSTSRGLGLGLGGARRLVEDFEIDSSLGTGTRVVITRWL